MKPMKRGVKQGCVRPMSLDFFSVYRETILRSIEEVKCIKVSGVNLNNIRFANVTIFLAKNKEE